LSEVPTLLGDEANMADEGESYYLLEFGKNASRRANRLMLAMLSDQRKDLIFSATMPKAKNQSHRVHFYYCIYGLPPLFCFFFSKKR
jgi:hypothetical protein